MHPLTINLRMLITATYMGLRKILFAHRGTVCCSRSETCRMLLEPLVAQTSDHHMYPINVCQMVYNLLSVTSPTQSPSPLFSDMMNSYSALEGGEVEK